VSRRGGAGDGGSDGGGGGGGSGGGGGGGNARDGGGHINNYPWRRGVGKTRRRALGGREGGRRKRERA